MLWTGWGVDFSSVRQNNALTLGEECTHITPAVRGSACAPQHVNENDDGRWWRGVELRSGVAWHGVAVESSLIQCGRDLPHTAHTKI